MKKIMFLQIKGKSFGGIWLVNKTLSQEFYKRGYDVQVCSIRDNHPGDYEETVFKQHTINPKTEWGITHRKDVLLALKKGLTRFFKTFNKYLTDKKKLNEDYDKLKAYIKNENPDYIIASHYQTLPGIPDEYLKKTIHVQHSTFSLVLNDKMNFNILKKYNDKLYALMWLCKSTYNSAEKNGFKKNHYIYNPVRFNTTECAPVVDNKQLIVLSRFAYEKRIDLMIKIVDDVFKNKKFKDWKFVLYGKGNLSAESLDIIEKNNQIFYKGVIQESKDVLLQSSCSLNTSIMEGFPLSIIESFACGVPALSFNYGEAANEQIENDYNGFVIEQDNIDEYKKKLIEIMSNEKKLTELSKNAKESSKKFTVTSVIDEWEKVFKQMDK